jgi:uncharacterized protein involved in outer membrane biogenesis
MRAIKIAGLALLGLLVLVGVGVAALVIGGDPLIARLIQHEGTAFLGREVRIGGDFDIEWGNPMRIVAEDVHVANAKWGTDPEMFAARRLEVAFNPWSLLGGTIDASLVALDGSKMLLETSADGKKNWEFSAAKKATPQQRTQFPDLRRFEVRDSAFRWHNGATDATTDLTFAELTAGAPDHASPITVAARGDFQHPPYRLDASVGALAELQNPEKPYPVKLDGELADTKVAIDGTMAKPLDVEGLDLAVALDGKDLSRLLQVFSIPLPETPVYHLAGKLKHDGAKWEIDKLDGRMGKSRLAGGVEVDTGQKLPYIRANLTSSYLDLADFKGFYGGEPGDKETQQKKGTPPPKERKDKSAAEKAARVIPDTKLPTAQLTGFNADVSLDAQELRPTAGLPLQRFGIGLALHDGTLALKPLRFDIADGEVRADLSFASQQSPPRLATDIDIRHVDLAKLFAGMEVPKQVKETAGVVGGFLKGKSAGTTQREVLANLDGDLGLFMEGGTFSHLLIEAFGLDVAESVGFLIEGDKPHPINCVVGRFDIQQGVATASTLLFDTTDTVVEGKGNLNLGDETIFLELTPYPKDWSPLSLRTPLEIRGTFANPKVTPKKRDLAARLGAAIGLGIVAPPAALLPLIETGLGQKNLCAKAFGAQEKPGEAARPGATGTSGATGSSTPPDAGKPKR